MVSLESKISILFDKGKNVGKSAVHGSSSRGNSLMQMESAYVTSNFVPNLAAVYGRKS